MTEPFRENTGAVAATTQDRDVGIVERKTYFGDIKEWVKNSTLQKGRQEPPNRLDESLKVNAGRWRLPRVFSTSWCREPLEADAGERQRRPAPARASIARESPTTPQRNEPGKGWAVQRCRSAAISVPVADDVSPSSQNMAMKRVVHSSVAGVDGRILPFVPRDQAPRPQSQHDSRPRWPFPDVRTGRRKRKKKPSLCCCGDSIRTVRSTQSNHGLQERWLRNRPQP